jgi:hypothetical protein
MSRAVWSTIDEEAWPSTPHKNVHSLLVCLYSKSKEDEYCTVIKTSILRQLELQNKLSA